MKINSTDLIKSAHTLQRVIREDESRPKFHFCVPFDLGFPADPNAAFFACGRYHLMFIYESREDSYRWGHAVSTDLLHWTFLPDALIPDGTDGGIYSGGVLLEEDGRAVAAYWALGKNGGQGGVRIATAYPPLYEIWTKREGYALPCSELGVTLSKEGELLACADPSNLWKEDGKYYMATGNLPLLDKYRADPAASDRQKGDWTDLFVSEDLKRWNYLHRLYRRDPSGAFTADSEDNMCPWFGALPTKDGVDSKKYLLLFLAHNRGSQYYIGDYDAEKKEFFPRSHGRMSFKDNCLFAPEAMRAPDGRLIAFHWMRDNLDDDLHRELEKGWSGIHSLPRELWLREDGSLGIAPIRELDSLRINEKQYVVSPDSDGVLLDFGTPTRSETEIKTLVLPEGKVGVKILFDGEKNEFVSVYADFKRKVLVVDTEQSGTRGRKIKDEAPLFLSAGDTLCLRVYIDGCALEVFANDIQAMTRQVFPTSYKNTKIFCFASEISRENECRVNAWDMAETCAIL